MFDPSGQFELQIAPNGRAAADEYLHQGNIWVEGREGSRYVLRFINRSPQRACVVFSVDGLDTIKGQPAGPNSEGYIVDANSSLEIPGWKLDSSTAAEFFFNKIGKSYAAASGANTSNVGVIGAMVFREMVWYTPSPFTYAGALLGSGISNPGYSLNVNGPHGLVGQQGLMGSASVGGQLSMASGGTTASATNTNQTGSLGMARGYGAGGGTIGINAIGSNAVFTAQEVGTGFGDATQFATTQTTFTRANATVPDAMLVMYYNTAKNLQKMGIQLKTRSTRYDNTTAKAFPAYNNGCTPPPGWKP